jgi:hypothetical protein
MAHSPRNGDYRGKDKNKSECADKGSGFSLAMIDKKRRRMPRGDEVLEPCSADEPAMQEPREPMYPSTMVQEFEDMRG